MSQIPIRKSTIHSTCGELKPPTSGFRVHHLISLRSAVQVKIANQDYKQSWTPTYPTFIVQSPSPNNTENLILYIPCPDHQMHQSMCSQCFAILVASSFALSTSCPMHKEFQFRQVPMGSMSWTASIFTLICDSLWVPLHHIRGISHSSSQSLKG